MGLISTTEAAREIGCRPRDITDGFYGGYLDESKVIRIAGRRAFPVEYVAEIRRVLAERGKVPTEA